MITTMFGFGAALRLVPRREQRRVGKSRAAGQSGGGVLES
jgi:hypothetical protein